MSEDKFKRTVSVLIAVTTLFAALLAQLEAQAGARDDRAGRDAKTASLAALGLQIRGDAESNFHYYTAFEQYRELETLKEAAEAKGDQNTAVRYETMMDSLLSTSPLLSGKDAKGKLYFDSTNEYFPDLERFEADTYVAEVQRQLQIFKAASVVKDGWDNKANAYVFQLTLLAVSFFLFGLAGTIGGASTRGIFTLSGVAITVVALAMAVQTYLTPVPDLRTRGGAIDHYAAGMGLVHQERYEEAVAEFDQAISAASDFSDAYLERGRAYLYMETADLDKSLADLQKALDLDASNTPVYTEISWVLYQLGRFDESIKICQTGLKDQPENLQLQFGMALALLANGQQKEAEAEYQKGLDLAAAAVARAKAEGQEPPDEVFANLDEASGLLDGLGVAVEEKQGPPPVDKIKGKPEELSKACEQLSSKLVSWMMALEDSGAPPKTDLTAKLSNPYFQDTSGDEPVDPSEDDVFRGAPSQISLNFEFAGTKQGQTVVYRIFQDGEELDAWRYEETWVDPGDGEWEEPLYPGYSESFRFEPGDYYVEVFVDYQLALYGSFKVAGEGEQAEE